MQSSIELSRPDKEDFLLAHAERAARHFRNYCFYVDPQYQCPPHLQFLIDALEKVESGDIKHLMVFMPPRHGKSETTSKKFPAWFLGRHPDEHVIISSYAFNLARSFSKDVRDTIEDRVYKTIFNISTAEDARMVRDWDIAGFRGGLLAQGVGGGITGYGANLFIIDDPFKNQEEAESAIIREKVWEWYRSVVLTRLEPNARIILIMTRWHKDDLAGRILASEKDWTVINLPALAEEGDALGRQEGEPLWPQRYDLNELLEKKQKVGSRVWAALFQGHPMDPESQKFRREWFRWYDALPVDIKERGAGIDTATSLKTSSDNTAMVEVCRDRENFLYVDDVFCDKITVSGFAEYLVTQHMAKHLVNVRLEKNNAGEAFKQRIDEVARQNKISIPVECVQTTTDKMVRAMEVQPLIENGTIRFNRRNPKVVALVEHLINFDGMGGDIDDDVDALGFAVKSVYDRKDGGMILIKRDIRPR